jgi:hypothetical protein
LEHFYKKIGGWSEEYRQGILLETILNVLPNSQKLIIAELGVYMGRCTAMWNVMLMNKSIDYDYYAIDHFKGSEEHDKNIDYFGETVRNLEEIKTRIKLISNDSISESNNYENNFFDIVYIDASHDYESVKNDILHWLPKVKQNGFLCGDDYLNTWPGVMRAVNEVFGDKFYVVGETQWYFQKK